jgi:hypothetical protein
MSPTVRTFWSASRRNEVDTSLPPTVARAAPSDTDLFFGVDLTAVVDGEADAVLVVVVVGTTVATVPVAEPVPERTAAVPAAVEATVVPVEPAAVVAGETDDAGATVGLDATDVGDTAVVAGETLVVGTTVVAGDVVVVGAVVVVVTTVGTPPDAPRPHRNVPPQPEAQPVRYVMFAPVPKLTDAGPVTKPLT